MLTTAESSALAARSSPLPGAVNWWGPAAEDIEDGFLGMPTRVLAFARWMPALSCRVDRAASPRRSASRAAASRETVEEPLQGCPVGVGRLTAVARLLARCLPARRTGSEQQGEGDHGHAPRRPPSATGAGNGAEAAGSAAEEREERVGAQAGWLLTAAGLFLLRLAAPASCGLHKACRGIAPGARPTQLRAAPRSHASARRKNTTGHTQRLNAVSPAGAGLAPDSGERRAGSCRSRTGAMRARLRANSATERAAPLPQPPSPASKQAGSLPDKN